MGSVKVVMMSFFMAPLTGTADGQHTYQLVLFCRGHVIVQVPQKLRRVAVGEIVIGPHQQGPGVGDLFRLGKVPVFGGVDVVQQAGELPVPGGVGDAGHPAHEGEGQHFVSPALLNHLPDESLLPVRHPGHHIGQVGGTQKDEVLHLGIVMAG